MSGGAAVPSSQIVQRSPRANLRQSLDSASSTSGDQPGVQRVAAAEPEDAGVVQPAQSRLSSEDRAMFEKIASQHGFKEAMEYLQAVVAAPVQTTSWELPFLQ